MAKVIEIHSGDCVTIQNVDDKRVQKILFASICSPSIGNPTKGEVDKPWAFDAKEFIRKLLIGTVFHTKF